jgi:hypothetical protein
VCGEGLAVNKRAIGSDQIEFHKALEAGYEKLQGEMSKYLVSKKISRHKSKKNVGSDDDKTKKEKKSKKKHRLQRAKSDASEIVLANVLNIPKLIVV